MPSPYDPANPVQPAPVPGSTNGMNYGGGTPSSANYDKDGSAPDGMAPNYYGGAGALNSVNGYDDSTQFHRSLTGSDRLAGNLYQANASAFGNVSSDRYYRGAGAAAERGQDNLANQQQSYIQMLQQAAQGKGPSAAQGQLRAATDANIASSMAMAASGRGPGAAGAGYQAANMGAAANQQAANQSGILKAQEMQSAQQQLGGALNQGREMNASEQKQNDDLVKFYMGQGANADQANRQAAMDLEKLRMQGSQAQETANNNAYYGTNGEAGGADALKTGVQTGMQVASAIGAAVAA